MEWLSGYNWEEDYHYTILVLTEEDVLNETSYQGAGFEVVILPKKFEDTVSDYLGVLRMLVSIKKIGEVIYV